MKVKLKQLMAGPKGTHQEGAVLEVGVHIDAQQAQNLIKGGYAVEHKDAAKPPVKVAKPEVKKVGDKNQEK